MIIWWAFVFYKALKKGGQVAESRVVRKRGTLTNYTGQIFAHKHKIYEMQPCSLVRKNKAKLFYSSDMFLKYGSACSELFEHYIMMRTTGNKNGQKDVTARLN